MKIQVTLSFEYEVDPSDYLPNSHPTQIAKSDLEGDPAAFLEEAYESGITVSAKAS